MTIASFHRQVSDSSYCVNQESLKVLQDAENLRQVLESHRDDRIWGWIIWPA